MDKASNPQNPPEFDPESFFSPWEGTITDWSSALAAIANLNKLVGRGRTLAWRGLSRASYSLHSSLYRAVRERGNTAPPEEILLENELRILDQARNRWRLGQMPALELLAHLQHYGAPTRLLDVSMSPLVALWFAVERKRDDHGNFTADEDGRLFAFDVTSREIDLDSYWGGYELPWASPPNNWQTGLPFIWRPPSYHDRIPAQNSAFLISGVPLVTNGANTRWYRKQPGDGTNAPSWTADEARQATSVNVKMTSVNRKPHVSTSPTFTYRVEGSAKTEIREQLRRIAGLDAAAIYPDIVGLVDHGAPWVVKP